MKILLIGHGRHGKDTVAEIMRDYHGLSFRSSSEWIAENALYPHLLDTMSAGYTAGRDWKWFYDNRHEEGVPGCGREVWFNFIAAYNADPTNPLLAESILAECDMYVGMRGRAEFEKSKNLFDRILWVDRSKRLPPESPDSMELTEADAHATIDNNYDMRQLWYNVAAEVSYMRRYAND